MRRARMCIGRILAAVLATGLLAQGSLAAQATSQGAAREKWRMKYAASNEDVVVTLGPETITCASKDGRTISIPIGSIREVGYDSFMRRRLEDVSVEPILWHMALGLAAIHRIKETRHFVRITWDEDGAQKQVWLRAHKKKYAAFLANLERLTGRPTRNLAPDREELARKWEQATTDRHSLRLEQPVWVNGRKLTPGAYQVVLLEKDEQQGDLYFFRGGGEMASEQRESCYYFICVDEARARGALLVAPVKVTLTSEANGVPVVYQQRAGLASTLAELRLGEKELQFPAENQFLGPHRVSLEEGKATVWLTNMYGGKGVASYAEYQGQPAIAFTVVVPFSSWGTLSVTRERIAYQPLSGVGSKGEKDLLDVERSTVKAVKAAELGEGWRGIELRLASPERNLLFLPLPLLGPADPGETPVELTEGMNRAAAIDLVDFFLLAWENFDAVEAEFQKALRVRAQEDEGKP